MRIDREFQSSLLSSTNKKRQKNQVVEVFLVTDLDRWTQQDDYDFFFVASF